MYIGIIGMSLALWTTGDANLYLPVIQTSSVFRRPQRVMTVICGVLGTIAGLGIYQHFMNWIEFLASIVPPLIGPVDCALLCHYEDAFRTRDARTCTGLESGGCDCLSRRRGSGDPEF